MIGPASTCLLLGLPFSTAGCVTPGTSTHQYTHPAPLEPAPYEQTVNIPFSETWEGLVRELAKSSYVINSADKASRLIAASMTTDKPERLVDCGASKRDYEFNGDKTTYAFPVAASHSFQVASPWGKFHNLPMTATVTNTTSLERPHDHLRGPARERSHDGHGQCEISVPHSHQRPRGIYERIWPRHAVAIGC